MSRHRPGNVWLWVLLLLWVCPAPGGEVEMATAAEALRPDPGYHQEEPVTCGPLVTDTCLPLDQGKLSVQAFWLLGVTGGRLSPNWRWGSAQGDFLSFAMPVKIIYGLAPRTEAFLVIPYVHNWARGVQPPGRPGEGAADFGGLGDINLTLKYLLREETSLFPAVTGLASVNFPTGHHRPLNPARLGTDALGCGAYIFTGGVNFFKKLLPLEFYGNLWYSVPTAAPGDNPSVGSVVKTTPGRDFVTANCAVEYILSRRFDLLLEVYSQWETSRVLAHHPGSSPAVLMGLLPGVEFIYSPRWTSALGVAIDLVGKNNDRKITPMFTIVHNF
jgi:hypothetical protein